MLKIAILAVTLALAIASLEDDWKRYKGQYNKIYSDEEDSLRRYIYQSNMREVQKHNTLYAQKKSSFYLGENQFADWTLEEFVTKMNGMNMKVDLAKIDQESKTPLGFAKSVDWRKEGYVTPVKDQGQCGSCWAFSATGSMEGQHYAATRKLVSLSESNLVDCSSRYGNHGCNGGLMEQAFEYVIGNNGIDTEAGYPYVPKERRCDYHRSDLGATFRSFQDLQPGSEEALQKAVATIGPISVAIDANHTSFMLYKGGVYNNPQCSSTQLDHGVLVVGYDTTDGGSEYYIVKNSWSEKWGDEGYVWMSRNKHNQCGIASYCTYPIA